MKSKLKLPQKYIEENEQNTKEIIGGVKVGFNRFLVNKFNKTSLITTCTRDFSDLTELHSYTKSFINNDPNRKVLYLYKNGIRMAYCDTGFCLGNARTCGSIPTCFPEIVNLYIQE